MFDYTLSKLVQSVKKCVQQIEMFSLLPLFGGKVELV